MIPASAPARRRPAIGWLLSDALAIAGRDLRHWVQQPGTILMTWLFPVTLALMFGGFFGGAMKVPAQSSYFEFLMPGMFTLTMFFGLDGTILAVRTDAARGVMDRFRSLPISSSALVLGRCLADMLSSVIGLLLLAVTGLLTGWRWHEGLPAALLAFGLLLLLRFALLWAGIYLGLRPELAWLSFLSWPLGFLSNVFVDPVTMPAWLGTLAEWNPISATGAAVRQLFDNPTFSSAAGGWASEHALLLALLWPLLITTIFLPLSARAFRNLGS